MTSAFLNALEAIFPAVLTILYVALIGFGVQAAVAGYVRFPRSLGITAGIGLSLTTLLMVYSYRFFGNAELPIVPLAAIALTVISWRVISGLRHSLARGESIHHYLRRRLKNPITKIDLFAAAIAILIISPVLRFGLASWTMEVNDFPNYAASAEIWTTAPSEFLSQHTDSFGRGQVHRAQFEKPAVVALQVLMSNAANLSPYQLLTPMMAFYLFIFTSCIATLTKKIAGTGYLILFGAVIMTSFSVIPISRIYDAQPGQIAALALLSCLFAILCVATCKRNLPARSALAAISAIVGASALGSNFTLVVGSSVMLGALLLWGFSRYPAQFRDRVNIAAASGALAGILSIPMLGMYLESFSMQTTGLPGADIPLASPLAILGQQISLRAPSSETQTLIFWGIVLIAAIALLWTGTYDRFKNRFNFLLAAAVALNAVLIGKKLGWNNYSTHKWFAVLIAFAAPLILARIISTLEGRARIAATALLVSLAGSSVYFGLRHGLAIPHVFGADLTSLATNEELTQVKSLNIHLGDMRENSFAALIVPSAKVRITEQTYTVGAPPEKGMFLVRRDKFNTEKFSDTKILNDTYALTSNIIALDTSSIAFTSGQPDARRFLFGSWNDAEIWGTWSRQKDSHIAFIVPEAKRSRDLHLTIMGSAYAPKGVDQTVEFLANGEVLPHRRDPNDARKWEMQIPRRVIEANEGWITVTIRVAKALSPSEFGSGDRRTLSFGLSQLRVSPAE